MNAIKHLFKILKYGLYVTSNITKPPEWQAGGNVIKLIKELGVIPGSFVDVGANDSQWARWFINEWPDIKVISFEPNKYWNTLGTVYNIGLSDSNSRAEFTADKCGMFITEEIVNESKAFPLKRFDSLTIGFPKPAILKIDAEHYTYKALSGFGDRINDFCLVICEMWNQKPLGDQVWTNQQADIWRFMISHKFNMARVIKSEFSTDGIPYYDIAFWK